MKLYDYFNILVILNNVENKYMQTIFSIRWKEKKCDSLFLYWTTTGWTDSRQQKGLSSSLTCKCMCVIAYRFLIWKVLFLLLIIYHKRTVNRFKYNNFNTLELTWRGMFDLLPLCIHRNFVPFYCHSCCCFCSSCCYIVDSQIGVNIF